MLKSPLARAIEIAGGQRPLARGIGVGESTVWNWLHINGKPPGKHVGRIAELTGVPAHELRPDLFPQPAPTNGGA